MGASKASSLGVIPAGRPRVMTPLPEHARALVAGATLAISVEPIGGSPTGQATGPVILTGKLVTS